MSSHANLCVLTALFLLKNHLSCRLQVQTLKVWDERRGGNLQKALRWCRSAFCPMQEYMRWLKKGGCIIQRCSSPGVTSVCEQDTGLLVLFWHPNCQIFPRAGGSVDPAPQSLQDVFICHLAPSGKPPSWENLLMNGGGDRMKNRISPFVNKRDKRRITAWLCGAIALE